MRLDEWPVYRADSTGGCNSLLESLSINHRYRDTRTRAAGLLMLWRRVKPKVIAGQLGVSGQSIYN